LAGISTHQPLWIGCPCVRRADPHCLRDDLERGRWSVFFRCFSAIALAEPRPPGWADLLLDDHPAVMERIEMAEAWRALRRSTD
jgi:hypothetical protein